MGGQVPAKGIVVDENQMMESQNLLTGFGFDIDVTTFAKNLSVSQIAGN